MIRFSLSCDAGHAFEGWFGSNADFDAQSGRGLVTCPACGSARVGKTLMAPAVAARSSPEPQMLAPTEAQRAALARMRDAVKALKASAVDVGERFAEEARRIHYGEADARGIYGRASRDEAVALLEEGIAVAPLPDIADDAN